MPVRSVVRRPLFELGWTLEHAILKLYDALPRDEPCFELVGVDGLLDVAVGAGVHGLDERLSPFLRRREHDVRVRRAARARCGRARGR